MPADLLMHSKTKKRASLILNQPPQALLVLGPAGSGKEFVAKNLAAELLGTQLENLAFYPYFTLVEKPAGKQEISIDAVRSVISELRLKPVVPSKGLAKRVVLINGANFLSHEAQNALLKVLEEPPGHTMFILTATSANKVLPTISSRTQKLLVLPVSLAEATSYYQKQYKKEAINSAWQLSQGAGGLLNALLKDDKEHQLKKSVNDAKKLLAMNRYDRLLYLDSLSSDKEEFSTFLDALNRILIALHHSAVEADNLNQSQKLAVGRKLTGEAMALINRNSSVRLIGINLALRLPV
jgi:DNA polymerase III delta prime subunit